MFKVKDNTEIIHPMEVADISGSPLGFHKAQNAGLSQNCIEFTGKEVPSDTVYCAWHSGSQGVAPMPPSAVAATLGNSVAMQILGTHPRSPESETLEVGLLNLHFANPPGHSVAATSEPRHVKPSVALC